MLGNKDVMATIPVRNVSAARKFYEGILGFELIDPAMAETSVYQSGKSRVLVYQSQYVGTNKATAATWTVGSDIEKIVQTLRAKGVTFEHYEMPSLKRNGDIFVGNNMKVAWFKDPDGNILALAGE